EIGPGRGALTRPLAARTNAVVAYEIDRDLAAGLRAAAIPNVTVIEGDFLEAARPEPRAPSPGGVRVAGNLPYNVASPILFKLAALYAHGTAIADATLMLQREVAGRLLSPPGTRDYGVLSVRMQHVAAVDLLLKLPAGAFRPPPKVLSSLVRLRFHHADPPVGDAAAFASLVQAVFTRRRKTLANALLAHVDASCAARAPRAGGRGCCGRARPRRVARGGVSPPLRRAGGAGRPFARGRHQVITRSSLERKVRDPGQAARVPSRYSRVARRGPARNPAELCYSFRP